MVLSVFNKYVSALDTLKQLENAPPHNDPFDRIMVVQGKVENLMFLTHDNGRMSLKIIKKVAYFACKAIRMQL